MMSPHVRLFSGVLSACSTLGAGRPSGSAWPELAYEISQTSVASRLKEVHHNELGISELGISRQATCYEHISSRLKLSRSQEATMRTNNEALQ
jgi:hypothetical protein